MAGKVRSLATRAALVSLPGFAVYLLHAWPLRGWIIDDAGVCFAYARNLAAGYGLVSQPGLPPVEGFSNALWTLLLAVTFRIHAFDPVWTPKILSATFVFIAMACVAADVRRRSQSSWPAMFGPWLVALSTSFVIWTTSGLENALLAALVALSCITTARALTGDRRFDFQAGALAGLLALTRPDALVYAAAWPIALALSGRVWRAGLLNGTQRLGTFAAGFLPIAGGYLLFRHAYFGQWMPNTFVAKDKPSLAFLLDTAKWQDLFGAALGPIGWLAAAVIVGGAIALARQHRLDSHTRSLGVHLALAALAYMVMPIDWMGEYRFATSFFLFFYWALAAVAAACWAAPSRILRMAAVGGALVVVATSLIVHVPRSLDFDRGPVTPFSHVVAFYGDGFNRLADTLPTTEASLLAPDVGGTLFTSHLRVYDLVGLCDATTARTLTTDTAAFHHYVLDEVRPTFIHVHDGWSDLAVFHRSDRFLRDYVPIAEVWAPASADGTRPGEPTWGDYVRRDALGEHPDAMLARLRAIYEAAGLGKITL